jgi:hypothetical protein
MGSSGSSQPNPGLIAPSSFRLTQVAFFFAQSLSQLAALSFATDIEKHTKPPCPAVLSPAVFSAARADGEINSMKRSI